MWPWRGTFPPEGGDSEGLKSWLIHTPRSDKNGFILLNLRYILMQEIENEWDRVLDRTDCPGFGSGALSKVQSKGKMRAGIPGGVYLGANGQHHGFSDTVDASLLKAVCRNHDQAALS
jgi:hypothetical protein